MVLKRIAIAITIAKNLFTPFLYVVFIVVYSSKIADVGVPGYLFHNGDYSP